MRWDRRMWLTAVLDNYKKIMCHVELERQFSYLNNESTLCLKMISGFICCELSAGNIRFGSGCISEELFNNQSCCETCSAVVTWGRYHQLLKLKWIFSHDLVTAALSKLFKIMRIIDPPYLSVSQAAVMQWNFASYFFFFSNFIPF